MRSHFLHKGL